MTSTTPHPLSDNLEDAITNETYGLFPTPVSKYTVPNHDELKQKILSWMGASNILDRSGRESITHNIVQIGESNKLLLDLPEVASTLSRQFINIMITQCTINVTWQLMNHT